MTFVVKQTEIDRFIAIVPPHLREILENFSVSVSQHAKDLNDYFQHMSHVEAQKELPQEQQTHQSYPAPSPPLLIAQAVRKGDDGVYVADFQLINDRPSVEQLSAKRLREKKGALIAQVSEVESEMMQSILGYKHRAHQFRYGDIANADNERASAIIKAKPINLKMTGEELKLQVDAGRSSEDTKFKQEHEARSAAAEKVVRHAAELHSQIDDLTEQNIDSWVMPPFPNV